MLHILEHTIMDSLKILPFLFATYLIIEYISHKSSDKIVASLKKYGVVGGALLGSFPQCGFSVAAANFYNKKLISVGTLIAVFISTSDEAIPVILANSRSIDAVLKLILTKVIIAIIAGLLADKLFANYFKQKRHSHNDDHCHSHHDHHHCDDCQQGIFVSAISHTVKIFIFMVITLFVLELGIHFIGEDNLQNVLLTDTIFQPAITALIGFIPNCASSIIITQLYISGSLSFGSAVAGLSTGAGVGLIVLFRVNKKYSENIKIMLFIYVFSVIVGNIIQVLL